MTFLGVDSQISLIFQKFSEPVFFRLIEPFISRIGKGDFLAFCSILLGTSAYLSGKSRALKSAGGGILALTSAGLLVQSLKILIGRARPFMNFGDSYFIGPHLFQNGFDSFPSGHATASFAIATFFTVCYPSLKYLLLPLALLISISRVVYGHHFLTDVIVGGIIGAGIGLFVAKKLKRWIESNKVRREGLDIEDVQKVSSSFHLLLIIFFSSSILLIGLSGSALWDRDETEYAQAVIEMEQKNEWLIPTLEGQPFLEKPIFLYWMVRISYLLFGVNEFSSRFPSALFGIFTCVATYFLGKVLWKSRAALFSALILSSSFLFVGGFRLLLTDPFFLFFNLLSFVFYLHSFRRPEHSKRFLTFSYISIGFAFLSKGPIALFPIVIFLIFEQWNQEKSLHIFLKNLWKHFLFSTLTFAIALPWFIYSFSIQKEAMTTFFLYENIARFLKGSEGHTGPMIYYIPVLFLGFFPWSFFLIPCIKREWQKRTSRMDPENFFLMIWILFIFIFFSFSAHKLPHYILPMLPPLACLVGKFWNDQILETIGSLKLPYFFTVLLSIFLTLLPVLLYWWRPQYASPKLISPFLILFLFLSLASFWGLKHEYRKSFMAIFSGSFSFFLTIAIWSLPWIDQYRVIKPIGLSIKKYLHPESNLLGYYFSEPSLFIYGSRIFPKVEGESLEAILNDPRPTYIILTEERLKKSDPKTSYTILDQKEGWAENHGEIKLMLIGNQPK